jgi:hypothetical protein
VPSPIGEGEWCGLTDQNLVNGRQQKIQLDLAFAEEIEGEALKASDEGLEPCAATTNSGDPVK